jgi:hypothetical protein
MINVARSSWFFAAVMCAAAPFLVSGQQQLPKSRAGWPCGARIDPSYFHVAEGTGGHMMLLAPEEIGDSAELFNAFSAHPQTILRSAGSITPGVHEFPVPIDPSVESVVFSISVQCLQAADVLQPSGLMPVGSATVTDFSSFRAQRVMIVKQPEPGLWNVRVAGSGVAAVVVQAKSALGIATVEFASGPDAAFNALPSPDVENRLRIRVSGNAGDIRASLVTGELVHMRRLPLVSSDSDGVFLSRFTPGPDSFRLVVTWKDQAGFDVQRMYAPLFMPRLTSR